MRTKNRKSDHFSSEESKQPAKKKSKKDKKNSQKGQPNNKRDKECVHCGKWHIVPDEKCWSLAKNKKDRSEKKQNYNSKKETEKMFSALQMEQIAKVLSRKSAKSKKSKRKIAYMSKVESETDNSSSSESEDYLCTFALRSTTSKKITRDHGSQPTTEVVIELQGTKTKAKPLRGLLDTGTTRSMVLGTYLPFSREIKRVKILLNGKHWVDL